MTSTRGLRPTPSRPSAGLRAFLTLLTGMFCLTVAWAAPASALERDDGDDPGEQITKLEALLLFGVVPLALMALITLAVSLPWLIKGQRKPGEAQPEWFGAPEDAPEVGGHGEQPALSGRVVTSGADGGEDDGDGGGSSARW